MTSQTDRQTKSTWWSVTAFDDEIVKLEDKEHYPDFIKTILGGREECPETGKVHFQGAVQCHYQIRFSQLKKWLEKAHLEPAKSVEALKQYAMKEHTAIETKQVRTNNQSYYKRHEILDLLAQEYLKLDITPEFLLEQGKIEVFYTYLMTQILRRDRTLINFLDGRLRQQWIDFHPVYIDHYRSPNSITGIGQELGSSELQSACEARAREAGA